MSVVSDSYASQEQHASDNLAAKAKFKFLRRGEGTYKRVHAAKFRRAGPITKPHSSKVDIKAAVEEYNKRNEVPEHEAEPHHDRVASQLSQFTAPQTHDVHTKSAEPVQRSGRLATTRQANTCRLDSGVPAAPADGIEQAAKSSPLGSAESSWDHCAQNVNHLHLQLARWQGVTGLECLQSCMITCSPAYLHLRCSKYTMVNMAARQVQPTWRLCQHGNLLNMMAH